MNLNDRFCFWIELCTLRSCWLIALQGLWPCLERVVTWTAYVAKERLETCWLVWDWTDWKHQGEKHINSNSRLVAVFECLWMMPLLHVSFFGRKEGTFKTLSWCALFLEMFWIPRFPITKSYRWPWPSCPLSRTQRQLDCHGSCDVMEDHRGLMSGINWLVLYSIWTATRPPIDFGATSLISGTNIASLAYKSTMRFLRWAALCLRWSRRWYLSHFCRVLSATVSGDGQCRLMRFQGWKI